MGGEESRPETTEPLTKVTEKFDSETKQAYFATEHTINISDDVFGIREELVKVRRYFHKNPELSFQETKTAQSIAGYLRNFDFIVQEDVGRTGVVALVQGGHDGPCIMLRADMDALPVQESVESDFKSSADGVMHACGHDAHMAIMLGVARVLQKYQSMIHGSVKLVFQPAEEIGSGARAMIADGVLENPHVDQIYGLHVWSYAPFGKFTVKSGPLMAGQQTFQINVKGRGGHAAVPHAANDPIVAACSLVTQLHTIVSRNVDPLESAVITVGEIHGGHKSNVIGDNVFMSGTTRAFSVEQQDLLSNRIASVCKGIGHSFDTQVDFEIRDESTVPVVNDENCAVEILKATQLVVPTADIVQTPVCAAEDMGDFLNERPGCFFFVGCAVENKENEVYGHHKGEFQIDERCLAVGCQIFCSLIVELLIPRKDKAPVDEEVAVVSEENAPNGPVGQPATVDG